MLKDAFFSIMDFVDLENGRTWRIALNNAHPIFQAHFAGNPIMPGACIVQLIKELTSDYYSRTFFTRTVKNMKFLQAINPIESPEISVNLTFERKEEGCVAVSAFLKNGDKLFVKSTLMFENRNGQA